jgi:hypothetical protein
MVVQKKRKNNEDNNNYTGNINLFGVIFHK